MNVKLIFYLSSKTGLCEKALRNELCSLNLNMRPALFATEPEALGTLLINAFDDVNIVFTVGGMSPTDKNGIENVLSKALADKQPDDLKRLKNPLSSRDGYLARKGGQLLIALPDDPEGITAIMNDVVRDYITKFTD